MAKTIKQISCPNCGSNKLTKQEHDYYMCNSCTTRFFLDTDNVTITHKHKVSFNEVWSRQSKGIRVCIVLAVVFGVVTCLGVISNVLKGESHENGKQETVTTKRTQHVTLSGSILLEVVKINEDKTVLVNLVSYGHFDKLGNINRKSKLFIHDLPSGEILKEEMLEIDYSIEGRAKQVSPFIWHKTYSNQLYLVVNNYFVYHFDEKKMQLVDVSNSLFEGIKEFEEGIVGIEKNRFFEEYWQVTNTKGQMYIYSVDSGICAPINNSLMNQRETRELLRERTMPNPITKRQYMFTSIGKESSNPCKLVEYYEKQQKGYHPLLPEFYSTAIGIVNRGNKKTVVKMRDFTPDRAYEYGGQIIGQDEEGVVIAIQMATLNSEPLTIQKLKHNDGDILWTKKTNWRTIKKVFSQIGDNFMTVVVDNDLYIIDKKGKIEKVSQLTYDIEIE
ncbi:MAG: hypothetical protein LBI72_11425 [Flavobacteriaceae bacterium]|jgi:hypothetical protein|nr:hypothetical protein [Flavobacteriaceae bacterium]